MNVPNFKEWKAFSKGFTCIEEAECLWNVCMDYKPKTILEIGRRCGISTKLFGLIAQKFNGHVISVDGAPKIESENNLKDAGVFDCIEFINHWSPWIPFNPSWEIDLLYIDGDHKYISALVDYHVFNFFVKTGGVIAFHDALHPPVAEAIRQAAKRDRLEKIAEAKHFVAFKKTDKTRRVYYDFPNYEFETI